MPINADDRDAVEAREAFEARQAELDAQESDVDAAEIEDFDAFNAEQKTKRIGVKVRGITILLPSALPMMFDIKMARFAKSSDIEAYVELLRDVFGAGAIDRLSDAGVTDAEFEVLFLWSLGNLKGRKLSLPEAKELADKQRDKAVDELNIPKG